VKADITSCYAPTILKGVEMGFIESQKSEGIATLTLRRGKVNALNGAMVDQLRETLKTLEDDPEVKAIVLTGAGKFFSFGFDVPEFLSVTKEQFTAYLTSFTELYTYIFLYPKPIVAALNGHTIAGGCMMALACDYRVMVSGKAKISLNEIGFGSSVFSGSVEMLRFWVGGANATAILFSGAMYTAEEARNLGLVQKVVAEGELMEIANKIASDFASKYQPAFASIKSLLRKNIGKEMRNHEGDAIKEFVDIWYSESTWANLKGIKIQ
jgi:Delta3-Delta2-enoyl-CoA isomerase